MVSLWRLIRRRGVTRRGESVDRHLEGRRWAVLGVRYTIRGDDEENKRLPAAPRPSRGQGAITQLSYL